MEPTKPVSLLALHRNVQHYLAAQEAEESIWLAARVAMDADGVNPFESEAWAATRAAERTRWDATFALRAAIMAAPHGRQADGSFVTDRAAHIASDVRTRTLWAPANQGPLAEVDYDMTTPESPGGIRIRSSEEAAQIGARAREERKAAEHKFQVARQEVIDHMLGGGEVAYSPGERGGVVWMRKLGAIQVPALGVFRAVGMSEEQIRQVTDCTAASWTIKTVRAPRNLGPMMDPSRGLRGRRRSSGGDRRGGEMVRHLLAEAI